MFRPFRLKRPIGPDSVMDRDDVLTTKRALNALGYLEAPDYGLTPYPDAPMIKAVKGFQRRHELRVDGVINPDGPTAETLGRVVAARNSRPPSRSIVEGEWDWLPEKRHPHRRFPGTVFNPRYADRPPIPTIFDVIADIGHGRRNDPRDVLAARRALAWSGHLPPESADGKAGAGADLFDAVRAFQHANDLKADGWMGPGGKTARTLDTAITPKVKAHLQAMSSDADEPGSEKPGVQTAKMERRPFPGARGQEGAPMVDPMLGGGAAAAIGAAAAAQELLRQRRQKQGMEDEAQPMPPREGAHPRTDIAPPVPPTPGLEPPDDELPTETESPIQTIELPDLSQPIPNVDKPTIFVHPIPPEDLAKAGMIIERKGNEATRKELERVRDHFIDAGWEHIRGGRYSANDPEVLDPSTKTKAGDERKEFHVPGHFGSLKGGHFTDLTFKLPDGRIFHVQTVDVDRNGKPSQRELDTAERIRRATGESVLLIPKGAQLDRIRH